MFGLLLFSTLVLKAQKSQFPEDPILFGQEMAQLLKDKGTPQLGLDFESGWKGKFTQPQKNTLIQTFQAMNEKGFKLNPHMQTTVRIILKAANHSDISSQAFDNFITTLGATVDQQKNNQVMTFLETTDLVLEQRALFYSSYNSLIVSSGVFDFSFEGAASEEIIEEEPIPEVSPEQEESSDEDDWFDDWDSEKEEDWDTNWEEESTTDAEETQALILAAEEPQMPLQGPVIKVSSANLTFLTRNDSVSLKGTNGALMTTNRTFVGKGGRFRLG